MSTIDNIITAATPGPWFEDAPGDGGRLFVGNRADGRTHGLWEIVHMSGDRMCDLTEEAAQRHRADTRFIATFDPEHQRLIEAVLDGVAVYDELGNCHFCGCNRNTGGMHYGFCDWKLLANYRKERGLL